ncbi:DUF6350 family protein [Kineococcus radiotolerans]|uniref:Uncharacterized protein n=1 Tax=Kineococcus radiotolerans (strain ATCC BAA-149 / DSM 14245 / SRS30216) TaxID=266940 RepID=A6WF71_KINRD|nr:DUF6350 family protein [Kineococcus radiotolerans]ABS05460.1 conserved hypothetical protein [Kineococcus radiotolerans SRS30216 = ATCC BAA-149]
MSSATSPSTGKPAGGSTRRPAGPTAADLLPLLTASLRAVLTLLVPIVAVCVVGWMASVRSTSSLAAVARVGADLWLLGHGSAVAVVGGTVGIAPLGITALAAASAHRAVRMWLRDQAEAGRDVPFWRGLGVFTAGYGVLALLLALVSRSGVGAASPPASLLGGCLVAGIGGAWALRAHRPPLPVAVPGVVTTALRPALSAVAGLLAVGALLVTAALVHGRAEVLALHEALDPGLVGGALLTLAQVLLLPTLAVWGLAWATGVGFAVGTGTSVAPGATTLDTLPTLPVLGALPTLGPTPVLAWAAVVLPVLLGAAAWTLHARRTRPAGGVLRRCAAALVTGALSGLLVAALAAFAGGPAGHGRMSDLGPHALLTGAAAGGEVAAGALLAVLLGRAWRAWRGTTLVVTLPDSGDGPPRKLLGE